MKPTLFVELCCGSAAVTLKLLGGVHARPPISYMGSKQGIAEPILWAMGLRSGQGADAVLLNDPGPWSRVWRVLTTPEGCKAVAAIIRGWIGEDARALWERLRAEPVPDDENEAAARWVYLQTKNYSGMGVGINDDAWKVNAYKANNAATHQNRSVRTAVKERAVEMGCSIRAAREATGLSRADVSERVMGTRSGACWNWENGQPVSADVWPRLRALLKMGEEWNATVNHSERVDVQIENPGDWTFNVPDADAIAPRFTDLSRLRFPPSTLVLDEDAAAIDAGWVAKWLFLTATARGTRPPKYNESERHQSAESIARGLAAVPPSAAVSNLPAQEIEPQPPLPPGTFCLIDPPYFGDGSRKITGYAHEFPRPAVVEVAERWKAAGAVVCVCECVPVPELLDRGWYAVNLSGSRKGQRRTFGETPEWLTLNREPAWVPEEQDDLFGLLAP